MSKNSTTFTLGLRGDFHIWQLKLKHHLELMGLWDYVSEGAELEDSVLFGDEWTAVQLASCAMRDVLNTLENDLLVLVSGCENATEV